MKMLVRTDTCQSKVSIPQVRGGRTKYTAACTSSEACCRQQPNETNWRIAKLRRHGG